MDQELKTYLEGMEERIKDLMSDNMGRVDARFDTIEQRVGSLEKQLARVESNTAGMQIQMGGMSRSLAEHDQMFREIQATQHAERVAFDALAKQLREHRHDNGGAQKK
jgi:SMC interacting uncharacterized protein involved in chromosome segregation